MSKKTKKVGNDITVIMPVWNIDEKLFKNAITSLQEQYELPEVFMIVVGDGTDDHKLVKGYDFGDLNVSILNHKESTGFAHQMNMGVAACKTKWFSFLEQDDEMSKIWLKNAIKYREVYSDIDLFLPLIVDVSPSPEGTSSFVGTSNEAVWAAEFSDEIGILDKESLLRYQNFNIDGMVMSKEKYLKFGGIKTNIKLTFMYEFLLRMTNSGVKTMVIPKLGYMHLNLREGGLFHNYKDELSPDEARWWLSSAKKEYFHIKDREISYTKED